MIFLFEQDYGMFYSSFLVKKSQPLVQVRYTIITALFEKAFYPKAQRPNCKGGALPTELYPLINHGIYSNPNWVKVY